MNRFFLFFALLVWPALAMADNQAQTMLIPQRIVLEPGQRFSTLIIKNSGTASGAYTVELVDMDMKESGAIEEVPKDSPPTEFSAKPFTRLAPRSVTLSPGEAQNVRVLVKRPEGMKDGEYRSHIKVRIINDNTDTAPEKDFKVIVKASIVIVVPLIIRQGETSFTSTLAEPRLKGRELQVYITRSGNRSSEGNLRIYQNRNGSLVDIGGLNGVPVYRPAAKRLVKIQLDSLGGGPLTLRYEQPGKDGAPSTVLAETTLNQ
jgi:hypothetical protein